MKTLLPVGKMTRIFGSDGEINITLYDTFPDDINYKEPVYVNIDMLPVPLFISAFRRKGQKGALVRFDDIDTPARAERLLGLEICVKKEPAHGEADDELLLEDLVGYSATLHTDGSDKALTGEVAGFLDSDLNPLFEVMCGGNEILVPAADEFIESVDVDARSVVFTLPEGVVDLNL